MTNKASSKLSCLCRNLKECPEKLKQIGYFSLISFLWSMVPHSVSDMLNELRWLGTSISKETKIIIFYTKNINSFGRTYIGRCPY